MIKRPSLRVLLGGRCPAAMLPGVERAMDDRLRAIGTELDLFADAAKHDLDDDDLWSALAVAAADVRLVRLALERRRG